MATDPSVTRWLTVTATALTLSAVALPPAAWFFLSYQRAAGAIEAEAELTSWAVTQVVSADPDSWSSRPPGWVSSFRAGLGEASTSGGGSSTHAARSSRRAPTRCRCR